MSTEATPTNTTQALKEETTPKTSSSDLKPILIPHSQEEAELIFERATYAGGIPLTRSPPTQFVSISLPMQMLRSILTVCPNSLKRCLVTICEPGLLFPFMISWMLKSR